jgi:Uma2 family endonuclease
VTQAKPRFVTFEEYLSYSEDLEGRFQLIDEALIELPPESEGNDWIALVLRDWLVQIVNRRLIRLGKCEIQVPILQKKDAQNRFPDLVILREEHLQLTQRRLTIILDMPPPQLVVEVVSSGRTNRDRDYINKRAQYGATLAATAKPIGVDEYWIVDPNARTVLVLSLTGEEYQEVGHFCGEESILSSAFPELALTAEQVFQSEN